MTESTYDWQLDCPIGAQWCHDIDKIDLFGQREQLFPFGTLFFVILSPSELAGSLQGDLELLFEGMN